MRIDNEEAAHIATVAAYAGAVATPARSRSARLLFVTVVVLLEGIIMAGYSVYLLVQVARLGITGPAPVSNPAAVTLEIVIFGLLGGGLLATAWGLLGTRRWARAPALVAQIIALVLSVPLIGAPGGVERSVGVVVTVLAIASAIMLLTPGMTQDLVDGETERREPDA